MAPVRAAVWFASWILWCACDTSGPLLTEWPAPTESGPRVPDAGADTADSSEADRGDTEPPPGVPPERLARLTRGLYAQDWLRGTYTPDYYTDRELTSFAAAGIRHLRLPVGLANFLFDEAHPEVPSPSNLEHLDHVLDTVLAHGLAVTILGSNPDPRTWTDPAYTDKVALFWRALATHLRSRPADRIFFKLLSNATTSDAGAWYPAQEQIFRGMREILPLHTFIATANTFDSTGARSEILALSAMTPLADPNVVYDFGFFEPSLFAGQGAPWSSDTVQKVHGLPYPGSPSACSTVLPMLDPTTRATCETYCNANYGKVQLRALLTPALDWAAAHRTALTVSSFGAVEDGVPRESRIAWYRDVRIMFEELALPWTCFQDGSYNVLSGPLGSRTIDVDLANSLGITP